MQRNFRRLLYLFFNEQDELHLKIKLNKEEKKIFKKANSFIARFHIANLKPSKESDFTLDELWGDAEITQTDLKLYRLKVQHDVQTVLLKGTVQDYYKLKKSSAASLHTYLQLKTPTATAL